MPVPGDGNARRQKQRSSNIRGTIIAVPQSLSEERGARTKQRTATAGSSSVRGAVKQRLAAHFGSGPGCGARAGPSKAGHRRLLSPAATSFTSASAVARERESQRTGKNLGSLTSRKPSLHCRRNYQPPPPPLPTRAGKEGILTPAVRVAAQE